MLGALGLGLGAPLFRLQRVARAQPAPRPPRLFILFIPHGVPWEHFDPVGPSGELDFAASGLGGFSPLEPYRDSVTVLRGIAMANDAKDHQAIRAALTGFPEGGNVDSIDYTIAKMIGATPHVLGAVPYSASEGFTENSYLARHGGAWVRAIESPIAAADQLFGSISTAGSPATPALDESPFESEALTLAQHRSPDSPSESRAYRRRQASSASTSRRSRTWRRSESHPSPRARRGPRCRR